MMSVMSIFRVLLFAVSFCGCGCLVFRLLKVPPAFVPAFVCSLAACALLLAGILNMLGYAVLAFVLAGIYGFARAFRGSGFRWLCSPAMLVFLGLSVYFYFYFRGHFICANDDLNQWAIAVRVMLRYDRLPRFTDEVMLFPSYPTGTAGFIYLICRLLGSASGGTMFFAQAFLLLSCLLTLTALVSNNRLVCNGILLLVSAVLLTMNEEASLQTLYVDTLLGIVCIAGLALAFYYRDALRTELPKLLPFVCFLAVTKGSGLYFSLVIAAFCMYFLWKDSDKLTRWRALALLVGLPIGMLLLWNRHADLVFEGGLMTRHSTSPRYMINLFLRKDMDDYTEIIRGFAAKLTDIAVMRKALYTWLLLAGLAIAGGCSRTKPPFRPRSLMISSLLLYVTYMLGLLGMYLFNMPEDTIEAFARYMQTVVLVLAGLAAIYCILWLGALPNRHRAVSLSVAAALFVAYAALLSPAMRTLVCYPVENELSARELYECVPDRDKETRYLVYVWDGRREQNYGHRMAHYYTYPAKSDIVSGEPEHLVTLDTWTDNYDYLIVFWTDDAYTQYAEAQGIDPSVRVWSASDYLAALQSAPGE